MPDGSAPSPVPKPAVPRELRPDAVRLLAAAGHEVRWAILRALASTTATALSVNDIAQSTGENANLVSKHIGVLRAAGAIAVRDDVPGDARRQMYAVPEVYRVAGTVPALDYGSCLLRFD